MISPTLDDFLKLAEQGNLIPVTCRILADIETPLSAYRKIRGQGESFLFESVEGGEHLGRYSFVGCNPRAVIKQTGGRVEVIENGKVVEQFEVSPETGRDALPRVQADQQVGPTRIGVTKLLIREKEPMRGQMQHARGNRCLQFRFAGIRTQPQGSVRAQQLRDVGCLDA